MIELNINNKISVIDDNSSVSFIKRKVDEIIGPLNNFYLVFNGKILSENSKILSNCRIYAVLRVCGGKGGFGSMLRAIGAQIEKTTNREACRDLSGRRLRDINEEKRLKTWLAQQAEREKESTDKKKKKLEKMCQEPKFEFKDEHYDKERSELPEKVEDAVLKGLEVASSSGIGKKRKLNDNKNSNKKKRKLWVDGDSEDELSISEESDASDNETDKVVVENTSKDIQLSNKNNDGKTIEIVTNKS